MGIFHRTRDIVSANIHSLLDKAEDPEKLARLMVVEIEGAIASHKSSAAGAIAARRRARTEIDEARARAAEWQERAALAVRKGRDDLAREALVQRRLFAQRAEAQEAQMPDFDALVEQHRADLASLEERLQQARDRVRGVRQRRANASTTTGPATDTRPDAFARFDDLEHRVARAEAEVELSSSDEELKLREAFRELEENSAVEAELEALKKRS